MTGSIVWAGLSVLVVTGIVLLLLILRRGKAEGKKEPNYRAIFIVGLSQISAGSAFTIISTESDLSPFLGLSFLGMGLAYMAVGLANRDKWEQATDRPLRLVMDA